MKKEIGVSIIIPVYNVEKYLKECLDSVLSQSFYNIEVICIEDVSTDGSLKILEEYASRDSRIEIIRNKENQGLSCARNIGLNNAKGKYICFVDSDDMLEAGALKKLVIKAQENDADVVCYNLRFFADECAISEKEIKYCSSGNYNGLMDGKTFLYEMLKSGEQRDAAWLQFWNRKSLALLESFFAEGIIHEDILFTFNSLIRVKKLVFMNEQLYLYRKRANSITTNVKCGLKLKSLIYIYQKIMNYWLSNEGKYNDFICNHYLENLEFEIENFLENIQLSMEQLLLELKMDSCYSFYINHLLNNLYQKRGTKLPSSLKYQLLKNRNVIVFGAGIIAKEIIPDLLFYRVNILAIGVSKIKDNPSSFYGIDVCEIDRLIKYNNQALVIVAIAPKYRKEVKEKLKKLDFKYISYI